MSAHHRVSLIATAALLALAAGAVQAVGVPSSLPGLTLQLEADAGLSLDGSGNILKWADLSGSGHDASGVQGSYARISGASMNGIAVPTFSNSTLNLNGVPLSSQQFTLFTVAATPQTAGSNDFREVISNWTGSNSTTSVFLGTVGFDAVPVTTIRFTDDVGGFNDPVHFQTGVSSIPNPGLGFVLSGVSGTSDASIFLGQSLVYSTAALTTRDLSGPWVIGSQGGSFEHWNGQIAAVLVYDRELSGAERTQVSDYLSTKYLAAPAVPEPGTWALTLGGLALLGAALRRRG